MDFHLEIVNYLKTIPNLKFEVEEFGTNNCRFFRIKTVCNKIIYLIPLGIKSVESFSYAEDETIQIWEDQWLSHKSIICSRLNYVFGKSLKIPARVCEIKRIDKELCNGFLNDNHLQGSTSAKFKYGLFLKSNYKRLLNDELRNTFESESQALLAVMTFSSFKKFYREDGVYKSSELIRFANLKNTSIIGGMNKLLAFFIDEMKPDDIMSYADYDWTNGKTYENMGFEFVEKTPEIYFKLENGKRVLVNDSKIAEVKNSGSLKYLLDLKKRIDMFDADVIVILGPTASGKTNFAVRLADKIGAEIISADSRQVYRNMDVGTGKDISEYHLDGKLIPYHLIDICDAGEKYNVARFQSDFFRVHEQIKKKN